MKRIAENEAILKAGNARRFNQVMGAGLIQHEYNELARALLQLGLPQNCNVLDVGTGSGSGAIAVARLLKGRGHVTGLDLSSAMLTLAAENAHIRGVDAVLDWKVGNAGAMPFADAGVDAVISSGSLHHWQNPLSVFIVIGRVLKTDGKVIVRDSKRLSGWNVPSLAAGLIGLTLPADFRKHYWESIHSSYTCVELQPILDQSCLKGCRVNQDLLDLIIIKA